MPFKKKIRLLNSLILEFIIKIIYRFIYGMLRWNKTVLRSQTAEGIVVKANFDRVGSCIYIVIIEKLERLKLNEK